MLAASERNADSELLALAQEIDTLPKPARGDRKPARALNSQGLDHLSKEAPEQAVAAFRQGAALDPADVEIIDNLSYAAMSASALSDAERAR
jgi:Flp pilus assembly protein TadD